MYLKITPFDYVHAIGFMIDTSTCFNQKHDRFVVSEMPKPTCFHKQCDKANNPPVPTMQTEM